MLAPLPFVLGARPEEDIAEGFTYQSLVAPWVNKGSMDGEADASCIREALAPEIDPNSVVICENLAAHTNTLAAAALRDKAC